MIEPISVCELDDGRHHRETHAGADVEHQVDRQQLQHGKSHRAAGHHHADEIPGARPDHRKTGRQRARINHRGHRVGGVVKTIDELKTQRDQQRGGEQEITHRRARGHDCQIVGELHPHVDGGNQQADTEQAETEQALVGRTFDAVDQVFAGRAVHASIPTRQVQRLNQPIVTCVCH
jgi:hypothetical protein